MLADERATSVVACWRRAHAWFAERGVTVKALLTDNGPAYRSAAFGLTCAQTSVRHRFTRPYRPQTNGKVERFSGHTALGGVSPISRVTNLPAQYT